MITAKKIVILSILCVYVALVSITSAHAQFERIHEYQSESSFYEIDSIGTDHWWINTLVGFEYTHNAGKDWHVSTVPENIPDIHRSLYRMKFINEGVGFCLGCKQNDLPTSSMPRDAILYMTHDGGATWVAIETLPYHDAVSDYAFNSELVGWVAVRIGNTWSIYRTEDGCDTWEGVRELTDNFTSVTDIGCVDETSCYIIYTNAFNPGYISVWGNLDITCDKGKTWKRVERFLTYYPPNISPSPSGEYSILYYHNWFSSISGYWKYFSFNVENEYVSTSLSSQPKEIYRVHWDNDYNVWFLNIEKINEQNYGDSDLTYSLFTSQDKGVTLQQAYEIPNPLYLEYTDK